MPVCLVSKGKGWGREWKRNGDMNREGGKEERRRNLEEGREIHAFHTSLAFLLPVTGRGDPHAGCHQSFSLSAASPTL